MRREVPPAGKAADSGQGDKAVHFVVVDDEYPGFGRDEAGPSPRNLLENALHASLKQPVTDRAVKVSAQCAEGQFVLSVANRFEEPLLFDQEGLPYSEMLGHGTGMISLRAFLRKYAAQCDFRQQDGWVTVMLYWHGDS